MLDPLTKQIGFQASLPNDASFAFSEKDAAKKLIDRNPGDFVIEWINGSMTLSKKKI